MNLENIKKDIIRCQDCLKVLDSSSPDYDDLIDCLRDDLKKLYHKTTRETKDFSEFCDEELITGYGFFESDGEVSGAISIKKIELIYSELHNEKSLLQEYEKTEGKIIKDIITDRYYIDTPENRKIVEAYYYEKSKNILNAFFNSEKTLDKSYHIDIRKRMLFQDGFEVSIQASIFLHSEIEENKYGEKIITSFKVGFPNQHEILLENYESDEDVYDYVPFEVVVKIMMKHGELKTEF